MDKIKEALKKNGKYWIAFVGDSITSTEWIHPNWREVVEYVLKEEMCDKFPDYRTSSWGIRCFNFGYDGATTKDILNKVDDINMVLPNILIGIMGGNDPTFGIKLDESKENLENIFDKIDSKTQIVWCNSTPAGKGNKKNTQYEPYANVLFGLKDRNNLQIIDMFNIYRDLPTEKFFTFISEENIDEGIKAGEIDMQHPNQLGNAYIAKVILEKIWDIKFDPEKYIKSVNKGEKLPEY